LNEAAELLLKELLTEARGVKKQIAVSTTKTSLNSLHINAAAS
jgi:hypothetical protein